MAADTHGSGHAAENAMDMRAHRKTYNLVIKMLFRGAIACFIIALAVIWLISHK